MFTKTIINHSSDDKIISLALAKDLMEKKLEVEVIEATSLLEAINETNVIFVLSKSFAREMSTTSLTKKIKDLLKTNKVFVMLLDNSLPMSAIEEIGSEAVYFYNFGESSAIDSRRIFLHIAGLLKNSTSEKIPNPKQLM